MFNAPWPGDPGVSVQNDRGKAKAYQVRQVLVDTLERPQDAVAQSTYRVKWSSKDDEFVSTVAGFPSRSWLAASQFGLVGGP